MSISKELDQRVLDALVAVAEGIVSGRQKNEHLTDAAGAALDLYYELDAYRSGSMDEVAASRDRLGEGIVVDHAPMVSHRNGIAVYCAWVPLGCPVDDQNDGRVSIGRDD